MTTNNTHRVVFLSVIYSSYPNTAALEATSLLERILPFLDLFKRDHTFNYILRNFGSLYYSARKAFWKYTLAVTEETTGVESPSVHVLPSSLKSAVSKDSLCGH